MSTFADRDLVIGVTPFAEPRARLTAAVARAGALGVLDLGRDRAAALAVLAEVQRWWSGAFGVRVGPGCPLAPDDLPSEVDTVVLAPGQRWDGPQRVLAEVTSRTDAFDPAAVGLIARGSESGGRVGDTTTFVLLQQLLADTDLPVWACGGIGAHTAAAAVAGGAAGIVLDTQLALASEVELPEPVAAALRAMDGSETTVVNGYRVYARPDLSLDPAAELGAADLRTQLLPVGQDAPIAATLARRHVTAGGIVTAVRSAIRDHTRAASTVLAPGSAFARTHGLRYPVAQGPMTRVSDRAAFAAAVADGGGLPFLALALMPPDEVRPLLAETAALLGDRPWGVGILGFVPPEIREAQLAAVHEVRPPYALIAGGRPSQAKPLEDAGIATFLHVPSPGLLDRFLAEGARRFVFEGRECGGHVGPRASFPLWDVQVDRLLRSGAAGELQVLFAGGIHDRRSAAMVAALAAPLAERGAGIGVLMGTSYLFTEEAVSAGAVLPGFQQAALDCDRTVLLETSPGHAVRCVESPYVRTFGEARDRLAADGVPTEEAWEELERLNLGRLRIAAKGLRRGPDGLAMVDADEQRSDGMFMIGDAATLRSAPTTIAQLHADVTDGACAFLKAPEADDRAAKPLDIAIVGMAGVFPQAGDLAQFWAGVVGGGDAVTEVPPERWDPEIYYDPAGTGAKTPSKWGGFLPEIGFDALKYGIPPSALAGIEPVQLLALEVSARALADAGYAEREFDRERASVIFGAEAGTDLASAYGFRSLYPSYLGELPPELDAQLPPLTEDSFPGLLANVIAGRIANRLDLGGANYTVDAACASSLAALDLACKELSAGSSDLVLCGGADVHNSVHDYLLFASVHALSPTGRCRPFDSAADGIALGEGVACIVLKRLADAERDGDRIYAVVKGVAGSSDGRSLGLTAPRPEGQRRALDRAYTRAGVSPADVGLVEAHGTGTVVGDRTELATLTEVFGAAGADPGGCALGSVKSQIGHAKCAAGLAGVIKTARALHAGVRPPTLHVTAPNPYWDADSSPFFFDTAARPWLARPGERRAGVSAFGFGGTNFHAVLAGYDGAPEPAHGLDEWPAELFLVRGADGLDRLRELVAANDAAGRPWRLRDLARTTCASAPDEPVRAAFVADDLDDLALRLDRALPGHDPTAARPGKVAFLFPGQGSQRPGMMADLFVAFPPLQRYLHAGARWAPAMFPPATHDRATAARQQAAITDTRVAQPALGIAGLATYRLLTDLGIRPDLAGGHSYGELVALCAAGSLHESELLDLSAARGEAILAAAGDDPGTMAAVAAPAARVAEVVDGLDVVVANENAPEQTVISGPSPAVEAALARLADAGLSARGIPVACAFHSPLVAGAADTLAAELAQRTVRAPAFPVWANTTAAPYPDDPAEVRATLAGQVAAPVRFVAQVEAMYAAGARVFVEAGPGRVLTQLVGKILGDRPHTAVAVDAPGEPGVRRLLLALAELATAGVDVDTRALFRGRDAALVSTADVPRRPGWIVNGHLVRTADGACLPGGLQPARRVTASAPAGDRDSTVLEFLRGTRELVAAQRDVLLGYLGTATPPALTVPSVVVPQQAAIEPEPEPVAVELTADGVLATVLALVSERTGYPPDMLDPDLDLEADLSIDSIKRTEILGELTDRLPITTGQDGIGDTGIEELARIKTLRGIVDWIVAAAGGPRLSRYVVEVGELPALPAPDTSRLVGRRVVIVEDALSVGLELSDLLRQHGAEVRLVHPDEPDVGGADVLVHLAALDPGRLPVLPDGIGLLRHAVLGGIGQLLVVTGHGGRFGYNGSSENAGAATGAGLHGLVRTIAREYPEIDARAVDVSPKDEPAGIAAHLLAELLTTGAPAVTGYLGATRTELRVAEAPLDAAELRLDPGAVVLLTGGARGITARAAVGLARATGCHVELIGRTPLPDGDEDPATASAADRPALRQALIQTGIRKPAEVEAAASRILAAREIRATLAELRELAASVRYHAVDVTDADAVQAVVADVYARHGRLDGVVHGAGILDDKLLRDKTPESFARVYATKVDGARALADALRPDVGFLVLFGSVSGVFGNRGQADYSAANDALDTFARAWAHRFTGRVVSVDWGPWAPTAGGMVTPELEREYARRGVGAIDHDAGVACLLTELAAGGRDAAQVVYVCGTPEAFEDA